VPAIRRSRAQVERAHFDGLDQITQSRAFDAQNLQAVRVDQARASIRRRRQVVDLALLEIDASKSNNEPTQAQHPHPARHRLVHLHCIAPGRSLNHAAISTLPR
jgi:hypothetical protein